MRPLFERLSILRSRDFARAQAFLAERGIGLDLPGAGHDRASFDVHYNGMYLPGVWLGYIRYGTQVTARVSPTRGDYWVHAPIEGHLESSIGHARCEADARRGVVTSPRDTNVIRSARDTARLSLCIKGDALKRQLSALLDDAPRTALEFSPGMNFETGHGRSFARVLRYAAEEIERGDWLDCPLAASQFEQWILTALLLTQPNSYSQALRLRARAIAPRDVARAVEYMRENLAEPLTLSDLVRESGVAGRTLMQHFRDFKGVAPMRYLRNLRLKRVRAELETGAHTTVRECASRWGFSHAGRFSIEYRKRFGETPSATLARRRRGA